VLVTVVSGAKLVRYRNGVAGNIHEHLLARRMGLAHGRRDPATPFAVEIAEPAVAISVDLASAISGKYLFSPPISAY
jgi:hypothetical protein